MSYIKEQRQASNFVNGESFARFMFLETCVSFVYICICHLAILFSVSNSKLYSFSTFIYLNSHMTKMAIKLWVVAQSLPLVCKRSYYFGWIFNTLSASTEFHSSSIKILIFLLNVFNTTVRIVKQLNIRNIKASIGTASPMASKFVFFQIG